MYQPAYPSPSSSASPYSSPPPPSDPYRSHAIPVQQRQPYNSAFSPPPMPPAPNGFSPMPSGASGHRHQYAQQYPQQTQQYSRQSGSSRYAGPSNGYSNGYVPNQATHPQPRHKGTLAPGQMVQVGEHQVRIERYLSEGGYAHVYLTTSERPIYPPLKGEERRGRWGEKGYTQHCLKRIAFDDDKVWVDVKKEIEVMKSLPPNPHLTQYLASSHNRAPNGGHEVFILMEFASGGGIIDLLNKRLRDRLKEIEILNIFTDVCEAVAAMHSLARPLLHRDLKIENVLSTPSGSPPTPQRPTSLIFKLCDFGSTTFPASHPPGSRIEADALAMDLNRHTTLPYRSPEMVEPMLGLAVGLPSDVWALGVLLYKLCYYTTPFEEHGTLAIVNAKYTFPQYPIYSPRLQHLIASMLVEQPTRRPTVFEVLKTAHEMSGTRPEIDYPSPTNRLPTQRDQAPSTAPPRPPSSSNLLDFTSPTSPVDQSPVMQPTLASTIQPQRRGRPTREREASQGHIVPHQIPKPKPPTLAQASSSAPVPNQGAAPKLQVTGERSSAPAKSPTKLDAFGMPALGLRKASSGGGFGDSFGSTFSNKNNNQASANAVRSPGSGFGDSFGASGFKGPSPRSTESAGTVQREFDTRAQNDSWRRREPGQATSQPRSAEPASSIPDGELSFESRFPSIEQLSMGDDAPSPIVRNDVTSPPLPRPPIMSKPSLMGNLTGGDLKSPQNHMAAIPQGGPQPRSTHVTGTAFNDDRKQPPMSSSPVRSRGDYFESKGVAPSDEKRASPVSSTAPISSPGPVDLMGDESSGLQVPSLRPTMTRSSMSSASTSRPLPSPPGQARSPPLTGHSRPLLPQMDSARPATNFNDAQWSPLEQMTRGPAQKSSRIPTPVDSSDEEDGPEDPSSRAGRQTSPGGPARVENQRQQSPVTEASKAAMRQSSPTKSANLPSMAVAKPTPAPKKAGNLEKGRPQSMYIPSSSGNGLPVKSVSTPAPDGSTGRPSHIRKGSITDIVSKYESLHAKPGPQPASNGLGRKPSVASKPPALRKTTGDGPAKPTGPPPAQQPPPSPVKSAPKPAEKPTNITQAKRHGPGPTAEGYSKSSSGRSFPITKPKPSALVSPTLPISEKPVEKPTDRPAGKTSRSGSPEKQQSVNSLIARWNQGEVGKNR